LCDYSPLEQHQTTEKEKKIKNRRKSPIALMVEQADFEIHSTPNRLKALKDAWPRRSQTSFSVACSQRVTFGSTQATIIFTRGVRMERTTKADKARYV